MKTNLSIKPAHTENEGRRVFLIDVDLCPSRQNDDPAFQRTGPDLFMVSVFSWNENHSFMHDLESFLPSVASLDLHTITTASVVRGKDPNNRNHSAI